jgi:hypothetical protein
MKSTENTLKDFFVKQHIFSKKFYNSEILSEKEKEELLKTLSLAMHNEISEILSSTNFKVFDKTDYSVDKNKLLYNSVDVFRYMIAIMNLYNITDHEFTSAFDERDKHLDIINEIKSPNRNQKVVVVDIDDVLCTFRSHFNNYLYKKYDIFVDPENTSYYSSKEVKSVGLSPERVFETFIEEDGFLDIPVVPEMVDLLHDMKRQGVYVQLLTSRPEHNLKCKYQTFVWLENNNIPFDNINFAAEKYIWLAKKDFYINNNLLSAIDDSPKHAMEYATHGIKVLVPRMPYNKNLDHANITYFSL